MGNVALNVLSKVLEFIVKKRVRTLQTGPVGVEAFSYPKLFFCSNKFT